jgi:DNA uptake protein ComE-like DNA-binding protein
MDQPVDSHLGSARLEDSRPRVVKSSAVKAGWICLILGILTFWFFGIGLVFFVATFILAIVAMCSNRVGQGVLLLICSVASVAICGIVSLALISAAFESAVSTERAARTRNATTAVRTEDFVQPSGSASPAAYSQDLLGTPKGSLIVNLNTASSKELESLPHIGSSRAELIIAHRPYTSVDQLLEVRGITKRVMGELRPLVKTDGQTEKAK